jgi:hypothetical protein
MEWLDEQLSIVAVFRMLDRAVEAKSRLLLRHSRALMFHEGHISGATMNLLVCSTAVLVGTLVSALEFGTLVHTGAPPDVRRNAVRWRVQNRARSFVTALQRSGFNECHRNEIGMSMCYPALAESAGQAAFLHRAASHSMFRGIACASLEVVS